MKETPETLESAMKDLMHHVRMINALENTIDEKWGITLVTGFIPSRAHEAKGEVHVRRGLEEIEKALGKKAKTSEWSRYTKELRHWGIVFTQYADDKTKVFVKAGCRPPKIQIVEDDGNG